MVPEPPGLSKPLAVLPEPPGIPDAVGRLWLPGAMPFSVDAAPDSRGSPGTTRPLL